MTKALTYQDQSVRFDEIYPQTKPIAVLRQEPSEFEKRKYIKFSQGYDDLDYLVFCLLDLPSYHRVALVRYTRSPSSGTEIWMIPDETEIVARLAETIQFLEAQERDILWVHPQYEQEL